MAVRAIYSMTTKSPICGPILAELRRGLRRPAERAQVLSLLSGCEHLSQPDDLWNEAGVLGTWLGLRGANVKSLDLLIATYALAHAIPILAQDKGFSVMQRAGVGLVLLAP